MLAKGGIGSMVDDFSYRVRNRIDWMVELLDTKPLHFQQENIEVEEANASWGLDMLLLRLIQTGTLEEHPRNKKRLCNIWREFNKESPNMSFSLDDVLSNGWVRMVWDEWYIPRNFSISRIPENHESKLVLFLKELSACQYPDERVMFLPQLSYEFKQHKERYCSLPEIDWFLQKEILISTTVGYSLNFRCEYVKYFEEFLLSRLWEEKIVGPIEKHERLTWWKERYALFSSGYGFIQFLQPKSKSDFLDACVERLLIEKDCQGWDEESLRFTAELYADYPEQIEIIILEPITQSLNSTKVLDRMNWLNSLNRNDAGVFYDTPRDMLSTLFSYVLNYDDGNKERIRRLIDESSDRPFFYKYLSGEHNNYLAIPQLLLTEKHLLLGMYALSKFCSEYKNYRVFDEWKEKFEQQKLQEVWKEGLSFFMRSLQLMDTQQAAKTIVQLIEWLSGEIRKGGQRNWLQNKRQEQLDSFLNTLSNTD